MEKPLVSIIIPVYNGSNFLEDAIDSALSQSYSKCEVIVVNDGSDDDGNTEKVCLGYGERITYLRKKNGGVASAINYGISKMKGEYFAWLSHDDLFLPNKIEQQMRALNESIDKDVVCFSNFIFRDLLEGQDKKFCLEDYCDNSKITKGIYPILYGLVHFCTVLVSKRRIEEVGLCNETLRTTQDMEWLFRLLRKKENIFIEEPLTVVRLHDKQGKRTIKEYNEEQGAIHISFLNSISEDEIKNLFGDERRFLWEMSLFYRRDNNEKAFNYVKDRFNHLPISLEFNKMTETANYELDLIRGDGRVIIFCAGKYGISLMHEMKSKGLRIDLFSDNNDEKWGQSIDNVRVVSPSEIEKKDLIIVAKEQPDDIVKDLREKGYINILSHLEIHKKFASFIPLQIRGEIV